MGKRSFSTQLRVEMRRQGLSVRALGKLVDPLDPERGRRRVQRHLAGTTPTAASRATYARVLESPELDETEPESAAVRLAGPAFLRHLARQLEQAS